MRKNYLEKGCETKSLRTKKQNSTESTESGNTLETIILNKEEQKMNELTIGEDSNFKLKNVGDAYSRIKEKGTKAHLDGEPLVPNMAASHVQGAIRYKGHWLVSHNNKGYSKGFFMLLDGEKSLKFDSIKEHYNHPGGMQRIGDYAITGIENSDNNKSYVSLFDLRNMSAANKIPPLLVESFCFESDTYGIASIGATKYARDNRIFFLMCIFNPRYSDNEAIDKHEFRFFRADAKDGIEKAVFEPVGKPVEVDPHTQSSYTNLALMTDIHENVYLIGMRSEGEGTSYADYTDLYSVTVNADSVTVGEAQNRHFKCVHGSIIGIEGIHFRWGCGVDIVSSDELSLQATQRNFTGGELDVNVFASEAVSFESEQKGGTYL
jgi:hypothetical protein